MTTVTKTPGDARAQTRETKDFKVYIVKADAAQGIIEAVVNVFGIVDLGDDIIHNGAYVKTLNERGNKVKVRVLDSHKTDSIMRVIGKPLEIREIGRDELFSLAPDVKAEHPEATGGLFTRTQFLMDTPEGEGAFKRLASGAVDEWSIALDPLDVDYGTATVEGKERRVRHIRQIRLYEYSPVIWGMNQATVTTDIKQAGEDEAGQDAAPETRKEATVGTMLEANLRMGFAYCVNDWLAYGMIDTATLDALNMALETSMTAFREALPAGIGDRPMAEMYAATNENEVKTAQMPALFRGLLEQTNASLQAVLATGANRDAAPAAEDGAADSAAEGNKKSSVMTGSGESTDEGIATPSITDRAKNAPETTADDIDRELSEVNLMIQMVA